MSYISVAGVNNAETDSALQKRKLDLSYQEDATKIALNHPSPVLPCYFTNACDFRL